MNTYKTILAHTVLDGLYYSKLYRPLMPKLQGVGVIFTLHHVLKANDSSPFALNRLLEITPEFLEETIQHILSLDYDIISLDDARQRLIEKNFSRKFVCLTLDDGYIDNYQNAFPIFKKYNVPFAIYVTTGITNGSAILWWRCIEKILLQQQQIVVEINDKEMHFVTETLAQKQKTFNTLYWHLRGMPLHLQHQLVLSLMNKYHLSCEQMCINYALSWDMLKELAQSPLATIGTHTANHLALAKLSLEDAKKEALLCRDTLSQNLQIAADHFCYPYGDEASANTREFKLIEELGFKTATTTRKKVILAEHAQHLYDLPRIPLNGHYQQQRYVSLFLSGVPTGLWHKTKDYVQAIRHRST